VTRVLVEELVLGINWPSSVDECRKISARFAQKAGIPGACGAIDGTHVDILAPRRTLNQFKDKSGNTSLNVRLNNAFGQIHLTKQCDLGFGRYGWCQKICFYNQQFSWSSP
jgi:hypothetical protein